MHNNRFANSDAEEQHFAQQARRVDIEKLDRMIELIKQVKEAAAELLKS